MMPDHSRVDSRVTVLSSVVIQWSRRSRQPGRVIRRDRTFQSSWTGANGPGRRTVNLRLGRGVDLSQAGKIVWLLAFSTPPLRPGPAPPLPAT